MNSEPQLKLFPPKILFTRPPYFGFSLSSIYSQLKQKGEAQNATQIRDKAIDELSDWLSDFIAIARIALEAEPQLLESLGVLERN